MNRAADRRQMRRGQVLLRDEITRYTKGYVGQILKEK